MKKKNINNQQEHQHRFGGGSQGIGKSCSSEYSVLSLSLASPETCLQDGVETPATPAKCACSKLEGMSEKKWLESTSNGDNAQPSAR